MYIYSAPSIVYCTIYLFIGNIFDDIEYNNIQNIDRNWYKIWLGRYEFVWFKLKQITHISET